MQDFPKMMYGKDGATRVVHSQDEEDKAGAEWSEKPPADFGKTKDEPSNVGADPLIQQFVDAMMAALTKAGVVKPEVANNVVTKAESGTVIASGPAVSPLVKKQII